MIIKSGFKDYYDFVANMYGGGDPKCTYLRTKLKKSDTKPHEFQLDFFKVSINPNFRIPYIPRDVLSSDRSVEYKFKRLVVAGKSYLCYVACKNNSPFGFSSDYNLQYKVVSDKNSEVYRLTKYSGPHDLNINQDLVDLSRELNAPVFIIKGHHNKEIQIEVNCPILKDYDFPNIMSPQEMYQELSYFMMNTINPSPDMMPPSPMTNELKIQSHGFDLKSSFRPKYKGKKK